MTWPIGYVSCSTDDGDVRIFDARVDKPSPLSVVKVHRSPVTLLRLHPQLDAVVSTDAKGIIGIWPSSACMDPLTRRCAPSGGCRDGLGLRQARRACCLLLAVSRVTHPQRRAPPAADEPISSPPGPLRVMRHHVGTRQNSGTWRRTSSRRACRTSTSRRRTSTTWPRARRAPTPWTCRQVPPPAPSCHGGFSAPRLPDLFV